MFRLVVAAKPDSIVMLEGGADIVEEEAILEALFTAHEEMRPVFEMQEELRRLAGKPKREFTPKALDPACSRRCKDRMAARPRERSQDKRQEGTQHRRLRLVRPTSSS